MKRFIYQAFTMVMGLVFVFSLCTLDTLHPLTIAALFGSEGWLISALSRTMSEQGGDEDVYSDR